jgi:hypothetical protein
MADGEYIKDEAGAGSAAGDTDWIGVSAGEFCMYCYDKHEYTLSFSIQYTFTDTVTIFVVE